MNGISPQSTPHFCIADPTMKKLMVTIPPQFQGLKIATTELDAEGVEGTTLPVRGR